MTTRRAEITAMGIMLILAGAIGAFVATTPYWWGGFLLLPFIASIGNDLFRMLRS